MSVTFQEQCAWLTPLCAFVNLSICCQPRYDIEVCATFTLPSEHLQHFRLPAVVVLAQSAEVTTAAGTAREPILHCARVPADEPVDIAARFTHAISPLRPRRKPRGTASRASLTWTRSSMK